MQLPVKSIELKNIYIYILFRNPDNGVLFLPPVGFMQAAGVPQQGGMGSAPISKLCMT